MPGRRVIGHGRTFTDTRDRIIIFKRIRFAEVANYENICFSLSRMENFSDNFADKRNERIENCSFKRCSLWNSLKKMSFFTTINKYHKNFLYAKIVHLHVFTEKFRSSVKNQHFHTHEILMGFIFVMNRAICTITQICSWLSVIAFFAHFFLIQL